VKADLDALRREHPGWGFTTTWTTAATGPDYRRLVAWQGTTVLTAASEAELRQKIAREEAYE
jgi:dienelactone hydrolase